MARSPPCCYGNRARPGGATGWRLVGHVGVWGTVEKVVATFPLTANSWKQAAALWFLLDERSDEITSVFSSLGQSALTKTAFKSQRSAVIKKRNAAVYRHYLVENRFTHCDISRFFPLLYYLVLRWLSFRHGVPLSPHPLAWTCSVDASIKATCEDVGSPPWKWCIMECERLNFKQQFHAAESKNMEVRQ